MDSNSRPMLMAITLIILSGIYFYTLEEQANLIVTDQQDSLLAQINQLSLNLGVRTKAADCHDIDGLADPDCTPGSVFPDATAEIVCVHGYTKTVRKVSANLKKKIYNSYGLSHIHPTGTYKIDHLIPLAIGGNNEMANLWPKPAEPIPGFREKDAVEMYLREQVCEGRISISGAQQQIATDWKKVYYSLTADQIQHFRYIYQSW